MAYDVSRVAVVACAALFMHAVGALAPVELLLTELKFGFAERDPTGSVVLVDIDPGSIAEIGQWPWPRSIHAKMIDRLVETGASEVAYDVDFSSPSSPSEDAAFEDSLRRANGSVILASFSQERLVGGNQTERFHNRPLARFAKHTWSGSVQVQPDRDGVVRRNPYGTQTEGEVVLSIPALLAGADGRMDREFYVDFGIQADRFEHISAIELLRGSVDRARIAGKKIIVGADALELRDYFNIPVYGFVSGHVFLALSTESLLQKRALTPTGFPVTGAGLLLLAALFLWVRSRKSRELMYALAAASVVIEIVGIAVQKSYPVIVDTSVWQFAVLGLAAVTIAREVKLGNLLIAISRIDLRNTNTMLSQVIADSFSGVIVADEKGQILAASVEAERLLSIADRKLVGANICETLPQTVVDEMFESMERFHGGHAQQQEKLKSIEQTICGVRTTLEYAITTSSLLGRKGLDGKEAKASRIATLTFADITGRRLAESKIHYLAHFDHLTDLPNRFQLTEALRKHLAHATDNGATAALIIFDLDRFKNINDTLGHQYGDMLLRAFAHRIRAVVGANQTLARLGGDEFALLLPEPMTEAELSDYARRMIELASKPFTFDRDRLVVGLSIGITLLKTAVDVKTAMANADIALYQAKAAGGNTFRIFTPDFGNERESRQRLEMEMWEAFDRGEFTLVFQPQVSLSSNEMVGVEALVRWNHRTRGNISASEFIPVAETIGLIEPLGEFVLREACNSLASLPGSLRLAVNVSPVQFLRGDIVNSVESALAASGLASGRIDIEITESLFIHDSMPVKATMDRLISKGITFILDDFGTGYCSLGYLKKFPVRKIKIDKSFISGFPLDKDSSALVHGIAALANSLDMRVIAEGIETEEQANLLRLIGCQEGQGYLFGKPLSLEELKTALLLPRSNMPAPA